MEPFVEQGASDIGLGYRYGSKNSVESRSLSTPGTLGVDRSILSIKSIDMGDNSAEESSSFSVCKVLLDEVLSRTFSNKGDLYACVLDQLSTFMNTLDRQGFSVLGLFSYHENHYETLAYDEFLYSRLLSEDNSLRFDYKKKLQLADFVKFLDYNLNQGRFLEVRVIHTVRDVTKLLKIGVNFYYRIGQAMASLFKTHYLLERVFPSKKDLLTWCELNKHKTLKDPSGQQRGTKLEIVGSLKRLQDEQ
jgi:hypothetical protein